MLSGNKNLKDSLIDHNLSVKDISFSISYTKTHKLITALYMVTDIIDKDEPIKNKLRTLGADIISDMHAVPAGALSKIAETVSFLNIASAMNFISEMNCAILKKELLELRGSIQEHLNMKPAWLEEFLLQSETPVDNSNLQKNSDHVLNNSRVQSIGHRYSNGHKFTRIGVQKGGTLMKALREVEVSDKTRFMFGNNVDKNNPAPYEAGGFRSRFDILKKQRRDNILNIIKKNEGNATIKDIRDKINIGVENALVCSEKTLQRELLSMTRDGVLNKTGEKRWTKYFLK
mgnify:FL=1